MGWERDALCEERGNGLWALAFSTYLNVGLLIIWMLSSVALLVCRVVMWNRKTMVYGRGVSCSGISLLTFLLIYEV